MIILKNQNQCNGCGACINVCTNNAIEMWDNGEGFMYPDINSSCIRCGLCVKACPVNNIKNTSQTPSAYACINKNEKIRLSSSSGGVFTLIAEKIINDGGVVFGAKFDERFNVIHGCCKTIEDIAFFRGSKYVQSNAYVTFIQVRTFLERGQKVLFTGTPCQIGGLLAYLCTEYDNLYLQDIICHGVPSPKVWNKYVAYREAVAGSFAKRIQFRVKPWKRFFLSFVFDNNIEYKKVFTKDIYMRLFMENVDLRMSCHNCIYKTLTHKSDITLADFWGIENVLPELDDDKGVSLVLTHSSKGEQLLDDISHRLIQKSVSTKIIAKYNSSALKSAPINPKRKTFFELLDFTDFIKLSKYCAKVNRVVAVKRLIYRILGKMSRLGGA